MMDETMKKLLESLISSARSVYSISGMMTDAGQIVADRMMDDIVTAEAHLESLKPKGKARSLDD